MKTILDRYTKLFLRILFLSTICISAISASSNGILPVGQTEYDFFYERIDHTYALSLDRFDYHLAPYRFSDIPFSLGVFEKFKSATDTKVALFGGFRETLHSIKYSRAQAFESIRAGFAGAPVNNIFVFANFNLDEQKAQDPTYVGKKWRGLAGDVEQAFINYQTGSLNITFGRFASFWGSRKSLILGPNAIMDGLGYTFKWGRLALSYRLAKLDGLSPERNDIPAFENRYFAGHRIDCYINKRIRIGASETIIFGGPGRQLDLSYLNPIIFFHSSQLNDNSDDNTFLAFDFDIRPGFRTHVYGQFLVDDYQIEKKTRFDNEPNELGFLFGTYTSDIISKFDLKTEYSRVNNWTYNQILTRNRYLFNGKPISAVLGNDYDNIEISISRWFQDNLKTSFTFSYNRQGEGKITNEWTQPWLDSENGYSESFPSGIVQKTASVSIGLKGYVRDILYIQTEFGLQDVKNFSHIENLKRTVPYFSLILSTNFSTLVDIK